MKALRAACVALGLVLPGIAAAQSSPIVVELYTSQGCSSCPPADALLHQLAARDDVLPLALHVDYWDYIGWKDQFADPSHAKRQKAYAHVGGRKMIYTPQMIVMGQEDVVGVNAMKLSDLIAQYRAELPPIRLETKRNGDQIQVSLASDQPGQQDLIVQLVRYSPSREVSITRGELAGHTMTYANVVEDWQTVGQWDGQTPTQMSFTVSGDALAAVVIQQAGYGAVVAAARID